MAARGGGPPRLRGGLASGILDHPADHDPLWRAQVRYHGSAGDLPLAGPAILAAIALSSPLTWPLPTSERGQAIGFRERSPHPWSGLDHVLR